LAQSLRDIRVSSSQAFSAWKQWIPAVIWLAIITFESTDLLSSEHTGSILYSVLTRLFGPIETFAFLEWHHYLRKGGHVFGYAILSYLLFRAWRATLPGVSAALWSRVWASIAFLMSALVASLDEWHQTFLPSRTGTMSDVILDSSAALGAQILIWLLLRSRSRFQEECLARGTASSSKAETRANAAET
jgi:VanZ family protein